MEIFKEPLKWMTREELVDKYWNHSVLLIDPELDENDNLKGGYIKAVSFCGDPLMKNVRKQYSDRKTYLVEFSTLVYKALGIFPFGRA